MQSRPPDHVLGRIIDAKSAQVCVRERTSPKACPYGSPATEFEAGLGVVA